MTVGQCNIWRAHVRAATIEATKAKRAFCRIPGPYGLLKVAHSK